MGVGLLCINQYHKQNKCAQGFVITYTGLNNTLLTIYNLMQDFVINIVEPIQ